MASNRHSFHNSRFAYAKTVVKRTSLYLTSERSSLSTGGPDVVFDYKTMYENTLKIALNSTCMKDLNKNVLPFVYLALF